MMYRPQERTAEEILIAAGFSYDARASAGWVKYFEEAVAFKREPNSSVIFRANKGKKKKYTSQDRLHALVRDGDIHLHYDEEVRGTHKSHNNANAVKRYISKFQKIDHEEKVPIVA